MSVFYIRKYSIPNGNWKKAWNNHGHIVHTKCNSVIEQQHKITHILFLAHNFTAFFCEYKCVVLLVFSSSTTYRFKRHVLDRMRFQTKSLFEEEENNSIVTSRGKKQFQQIIIRKYEEKRCELSVEKPHKNEHTHITQGTHGNSVIHLSRLQFRRNLPIVQ